MYEYVGQFHSFLNCLRDPKYAICGAAIPPNVADTRDMPNPIVLTATGYDSTVKTLTAERAPATHSFPSSVAMIRKILTLEIESSSVVKSMATPTGMKKRADVPVKATRAFLRPSLW